MCVVCSFVSRVFCVNYMGQIDLILEYDRSPLGSSGS